MPKETLTVRVETEIREALDAIAEALDRDRSHVVNEALAACVDIHQWQVEHIRRDCARRIPASLFPHRTSKESSPG